MTVDSNFLITGRQIRTEWRTEEEQFTKESLSFTKRNMSLLDFLASTSHAGNEISVKTSSYEATGPLAHIGKDFFTIASPDSPRLFHSFVLNNDTNSGLPNGIEIEILERTPKAQSIRLMRQNKSFRSLLDDVSIRPDHTEIETLQGNLYEGKFELYSDFIAITENAHSRPDQTLVKQGTVIIPIEQIISVLYAF